MGSNPSLQVNNYTAYYTAELGSYMEYVFRYLVVGDKGTADLTKHFTTTAKRRWWLVPHTTRNLTNTSQTPHVTSQTPHVTSQTLHVTSQTPHVN